MSAGWWVLGASFMWPVAGTWAGATVARNEGIMNDGGAKKATDDFEQALGTSGAEQYVLRLYVAGTTPRSALAIENIKNVCEEHLQGRYDLEVIDLYQQPELAKSAQIMAAPTLIKKLPPPLRKLIGNLSDLQRVLVGLDLVPSED